MDRREFIKLAGAALLAPAVGKLLPEGLESDHTFNCVVVEVVGEVATCDIFASSNGSFGKFRISPVADHVRAGDVFVLKNGKTYSS
jgi:hypothetical protein